MEVIASDISHIFNGIGLDSREMELLARSFEKVKLKKGSVLLKANEPVEVQYYVQKGCLRTYFLDLSGKEYTIQFAIDDWWISDYTAFFTTDKALLNIECLQDSVLLKVSKVQMDQWYAQIPQVETFFRKKMEKAFARFQYRILSNLAKSAKERYLDFVETYPNIEQEVKNYHIASYLGITTESLSRIRRELASD